MSKAKTVTETTASGTQTSRTARDAGHAERMTRRIQQARPDSKVRTS